MPLEKQTNAPTLAHKGVGYGLPGELCDGNDVLATYAVAKRAVDRARRGEGPTLIEALTYRMEAHTTSDDPTRYRTEEELEAAAATDPIARMKLHLERTGKWDSSIEDQIEEMAAAESARMREEIYDAPHGDPMELFEHVYVDDTNHFDDQRRMLADELAAGEHGNEGA